MAGPEPEAVPTIHWNKGSESQWRTPQGLTLRLALRAVEKLNGRRFRLAGFGWDYGGTSISWAGGALDRTGFKDCGVWARFQPEYGERSSSAEIRLLNQVTGDRDFSSGHPAMQASKIRVAEFGLSFEEIKSPANSPLQTER